SIQKGLWKPERKLVACYALDTEWGRTVAGSLRKAFSDRGWEISSEDYFSVTQTDFYPLMAKYKKSGATVIAGTSSTPPITAAFTKQAAEVGVKAMIINDGLGWIGEWYELTGPASDYTLDMIPQFASPKAKEWAKRYEKKFGYYPGATASGLDYDNIGLFIKIAKRTLEKYGKIDKDSLHAVIVDELCTGQLTYGEDEGAILVKKFEYRPELGNVPVVGKDHWFLPVIQYMKGEGKVVYPPDVKEAEPMFR
ncbi:MAG: ABC transporter substrate-binding protein, partial [Thermodesulfobacteriota bacterium]